ncbi:MAG TPA: hypothetical protein VFN26_20575 [Candidatus Acidoferrum sp.]|nr:hypothetical protein [Candidatus Acidoferrum sp.]
MTLIELLFFVLFAFVGANVALWGYHRYSWLGGVGGFIAGFFGTWGGLYCVAAVLDFFSGILYSGWPRLPACRAGKCHLRRDYKFARFGGQFCNCCQCGAHYQKRGRRFVEVQADGSVRSYMIWKPLRGWFPEGE